ncbi:methyltransferase [Chamaesiphon polymorphus]|uniref:Methyltransferase n=1 Tax=Chamaesiphon polymorphus CCALA 037 TaxID=2107692 RepID=A0A2T1GG25_9CYAN|nr:methyltransferase [Chamaesiphon polymorphus]PSB56530.1 methyltransferase [Chamaesiphon polymorphus CCALA 037]
MNTTPDPSRILEVGFGFWSSKVLLTAVELGVFTALADRSMTGEELGSQIKLHPRGIYDFFDALVALGFLSREGTGASGLYRNTAATATFLDKNRPGYIGGILEMANARLFKSWSDLGEALQTGQPQNEVKHSQTPLFETLYADPDRLEQFIAAMSSLSRGNFQAFATKFDFSNYKTLCDVGGAAGIMSQVITTHHPQIQCISFDLPQVEPIAKRSIAQAGLSDRIQVVSGDFFNDALPKADIITMSAILHDWNLEIKKHLIRLAYESLPEGGALVAIENLIDDDRKENAFGLMMSLNMLVETGDGFDYTGADFWSWCQEIGFKRYEVLHLAGPCSAAIAYK